MPYLGSKPTDAPLTAPTQAALEAETDEDTYVTPDLIRFSPGVAKAWINMTGTGTIAIRDSHNVSSIADRGTGFYSISFDNNLGNANYCAVSMGQDERILSIDTATTVPTAGRCDIESRLDNGQEDDQDRCCVLFFGD